MGKEQIRKRYGRKGKCGKGKDREGKGKCEKGKGGKGNK